MFRNLRGQLLPFLLIALLLLVFQNCGDSAYRAADSTNGTLSGDNWNLDIDDNHIDKPVTRAKFRPSAEALQGNRVYMFNILADIFGPTVRHPLALTIGWQADTFGSGHSLYSQRIIRGGGCRSVMSPLLVCSGGLLLDPTVVPNLGASGPREGRRMSACHLGVTRKGNLRHALRRIKKGTSLESPPELNNQTVHRAYQLFFRGKPQPSDQVVEALKIVHQSEDNDLDGWSALLLSICLSPHWQVL